MNVKTLTTSLLVLGTALASSNLATASYSSYNYPQYVTIGTTNYGSVSVGLDFKTKSSTTPTEFYSQKVRPQSSFRALNLKASYTFVEDFGNFDLGVGPSIALSFLQRFSDNNSISKNSYTEFAAGANAIASFKFSEYHVLRPYLKVNLSYGYGISAASKEKNLSGFQTSFGLGLTVYETFFAEFGLNSRRLSNSSFNDYYVPGYRINHFYWSIGTNF